MSGARTLRRRLLARALLALLLAIATTLALCWGAPQFTRMPDVVAVGPGVKGTFWVDESHGGHWIATRTWSWESLDLRRIIFAGSPRDQPYYRTSEPPWWARRLSIDGREGFQEVLTVATGWPWRAVAWERWIRWQVGEPVAQWSIAADGSLQMRMTTPPSDEQRHAIDFERWGRRWILPMRVLWPGALADFASAWLAWMLLLVGPLGLRALVRRWQHRCIQCGYSRRGAESLSACPECGAALNRAAPIAPSIASSRS